jgi:tight adherence protein B
MLLFAMVITIMAVAAIGAVIWMWWEPKVRHQMRLASVSRPGAKSAPTQAMPRPEASDLRRPSSGSDSIVSVWLAGVPWFERLQLEILGAGWLLRPAEFVYLCGISGLAGSALLLLATRNTALGIVGLFAAIVPWMMMKSKQAQRSKQLSSEIPDALDMLCSALRSGFSISRGMQLVQSQMHPPISVEFGRVLDEVQYGISLPEALDGIVLRTQNYDMELLVAAVQTQLELGGNLAEVLGNISGMVRERVKLAGEIGAATAEGRLSAGVLLVMPFAMALIIQIINPGYMSPLFHSALGIMLLVAGAGLITVGGLVLRKLITIEL